MLKYILTVLLFVHSTQSLATAFIAKVVGVTDGDTITVLDDSNTQFKIRLSGIDAPEKKQPFGQVSKQSLSDLVYDRTVVIDWNKKDRYGRIVAKVLLSNTDINLVQVQRGLAWHYTKYKKEQPFDDRLIYIHAQEQAMQAQLGLWVEPQPTAPWDWRRPNKR